MNDSLFLLFTGLLLSSFDDVLARLFLGSASLVALGGDALAGARMSTRLTTFTSTHGVIDGIHHNTTVARTATQVTITTCLTPNLKIMLGVTDDTDCSTTRLKNHTHLTTRHLNDSVFVVARHQLCIGSCRTNHLGTLARAKFDIVDKGSERNFGKQKGIADFRGCTLTGHYCLSYLEALGAENVTLLTVGIAYKCDTRTTVRVILNGLDNSWNAIFAAFEVDKTIQFLVATANVTHGHLTLVVTATAFADTIHEALFRLGSGNIVVCNNEFVALTGGCWFNFL